MSTDCRIVALLLIIGLLGSIQPARASSEQSDVIVYDDVLASGWVDWSWNTGVNFQNASPVHTGNHSLAITYNAAWAGLYLHVNSTLNGHAFTALRFWIHGGASGGQGLDVVLYDANNQAGPAVSVTPLANAWSQIDVPLSALGSPTAISGIVWQDTTGGAQSTFYLDDVTLIATNVPLTLSVDAGANRHAISPFIYGMNFVDEALAAELRLPVQRWGGNSTSRYNWQIDAYNTGSDWYFENIANPNSNVGALPNGSASDKFVEQDRRTGTQTLMTMPLIGWAAKRRVENHPFDCGFKVSRYGPQQSVDPYDTDCGNGMIDSTTPITGNDPLDTSVAITTTFVMSWVHHLVDRYGTAANGGVQLYSLDNEPMLWDGTHRDVHPQPTSYDEVRDRTLEYAAAIKAADSTAQTLGPVEWGWTGYFYSALDWAPGGDWWNHPQDRLAHGNVPFVEWYLQQLRSYEQTHGQRILDFLDLHYYPQAPNVALSPAGDANTQALRLRSTRGLWDPDYVDESWINEAVNLIPRMKAWVNADYPGTMTAITEYNWGALDHINGALAQADVLGIFGREGLDLATLWGPPEANQPGAFAFRMYRNYDDAGHAFGDISVRAMSSDSDQLAIFAAQRAVDFALTAIIINKTNETLTETVTLSNFNPITTAQVFRYSAANFNAIVPQPDIAVSANGFTLAFPPASITLVVLMPAVPLQQVYLPAVTR